MSRSDEDTDESGRERVVWGQYMRRYAWGVITILSLAVGVVGLLYATLSYKAKKPSAIG